MSYKPPFLSIPGFLKIGESERANIIDLILENRKKYYPTYKYSFPLFDDPEGCFRSLYYKHLDAVINLLGGFHLRFDNAPLCWCYYGSQDNSPLFFHDHLLTSTISSVYYLQVNPGDNIIFRSPEGEEFTHYPEEGDLICFPNYLTHSPGLPVNYKRPRCSINMEIMAHESAHSIFPVPG